MMNIIIWTSSIILLILSLIKDREKTLRALKIAWKAFSNIASVFVLVLVLYALFVAFVPTDVIQRAIGGESGVLGVIIALGLGSVSVMPGFAAFPLCAALYTQHIPYYILAAFSVSLMNVGVVTFPIERKFLGTKVALVRNLLGLAVSIVTVIVVKLVMGE